MKSIKDLVPVDYSNQRVLTTAQVAEAYETSVNNIKKNFNANKEQFTEGTHYFKVTGEALKRLQVTAGYLQISSKARSLLLWTEHGALLHCKMINTDAAWKVFQDLSNFYFAHRNDDTDALKAEIAALKKENAALKANRPVARPLNKSKVPDAVEDIFNMMREVERLGKNAKPGQIFTVKFPW